MIASKTYIKNYQSSSGMVRKMYFKSIWKILLHRADLVPAHSSHTPDSLAQAHYYSV